MNYNKAISSLGFEKLAVYYGLLQTNGLSCVSIGSGNGSVERQLAPDGSIICVDPEPTKFQKNDPEHQSQDPAYATTDTLVVDQPNLVDGCNMFLNYPYSNKEGRYDVEAVKLLRPKQILAVLDTSGGAGSDLFLEWLKDVVPNMDAFMMEKDFYWAGVTNQEDLWLLEEMPNYSVMESTAVSVGGTAGPFIRRYLLLVRTEDLPENYETTQVRFVDTGEVDDCTIC